MTANSQTAYTPTDDILEFLREYSKRSLLIAIDGHSASGKSTLAERLKDCLEEATLIHTDDFYRVMSEEVRADLSPQEGYEQFYDWQRLRAQVLTPLSRGEAARYQRYDWENNRLGEWVEVEPEGVIVVEGCYSSRPELRPYYHLIIHTETPRSVRMERQKKRHDYDEVWVARWEAAEAYYFANAVFIPTFTLRGDTL